MDMELSTDTPPAAQVPAASGSSDIVGRIRLAVHALCQAQISENAARQARVPEVSALLELVHGAASSGNPADAEAAAATVRDEIVSLLQPNTALPVAARILLLRAVDALCNPRPPPKVSLAACCTPAAFAAAFDPHLYRLCSVALPVGRPAECAAVPGCVKRLRKLVDDWSKAGVFRKGLLSNIAKHLDAVDAALREFRAKGGQPAVVPAPAAAAAPAFSVVPPPAAVAAMAALPPGAIPNIVTEESFDAFGRKRPRPPNEAEKAFAAAAEEVRAAQKRVRLDSALRPEIEDPKAEFEEYWETYAVEARYYEDDAAWRKLWARRGGAFWQPGLENREAVAAAAFAEPVGVPEGSPISTGKTERKEHADEDGDVSMSPYTSPLTPPVAEPIDSAAAAVAAAVSAIANAKDGVSASSLLSSSSSSLSLPPQPTAQQQQQQQQPQPPPPSDTTDAVMAVAAVPAPSALSGPSLDASASSSSAAPSLDSSAATTATAALPSTSAAAAGQCDASSLLSDSSSSTLPPSAASNAAAISAVTTTADSTRKPRQFPHDQQQEQPCGVVIWDLDETLIIFESLLVKEKRARYPWKDEEARAVEIGDKMAGLIYAVADGVLFFQELEAADGFVMTVDEFKQHDDGKYLSGYDFSSDGLALPFRKDGSNDSSSSADLSSLSLEQLRKLAYRYRRIRELYSAVASKEEGVKAILTGQESARLSSLLSATEALTSSWLSRARAALQASAQLGLTNVLVTTGQLIPTLAKLMLYGLAPFFPPDAIWSSYRGHKYECFASIVARFGRTVAAPAGAAQQQQQQPLKYLVVGDGEAESQACSRLARQWEESGGQDGAMAFFFRISSIKDFDDLPEVLSLIRPKRCSGTSSSHPSSSSQQSSVG